MRFFLTCLGCFLLLGSAGCGYRVGGMMHPQIKTIAVAPVVNETLMYNAAAVVRGALCERFTTDGSVKLVSQSKADCILYARVLSATFMETSWSSHEYQNGQDSYTPNEWTLSLEIEYSVVLPGKLEPLVSKRRAQGSTSFTSGPDIESSRLNAMRQAAFDASKSIVSAITEGW